MIFVYSDNFIKDRAKKKERRLKLLNDIKRDILFKGRFRDFITLCFYDVVRVRTSSYEFVPIFLFLLKEAEYSFKINSKVISKEPTQQRV